MNRLLALVAVAIASLGTGCIVQDTCDVRVEWPTFQPADGSAPLSCFGAGVDRIDVWVDGGSAPRASVPCDGIDFVDLTVSPGYHYWSVEGIEGGRVAYRHPFELGDSCGLGSIVTTPAAGELDLAYRFYDHGTQIGTQACASPSLLFASVYDWIAQTDAVPGTAAYTCTNDLHLVLELPVGDYTLDWMEETGPAPDYVLKSADCTDRDFFVDPGARTQVPVNLAIDAPGECATTVPLRAPDSAGRPGTPRRPGAVGAAPVLKAIAQ